MTKTKFWLSILAISVVLIAGSLAVSPIAIASDDDDEDDEDDDETKPPKEVIVANTEPIPVTGSISANPVCPAENVQHWMNFSVQVVNPLIHATEPDIPVTFIYVQVPRDGSELYHVELKQQNTADRLNELGYTQTDGTPVESSDIGGVNTNAGFIGYSTICAEN